MKWTTIHNKRELFSFSFDFLSFTILILRYLYDFYDIAFVIILNMNFIDANAEVRLLDYSPSQTRLCHCEWYCGDRGRHFITTWRLQGR